MAGPTGDEHLPANPEEDKDSESDGDAAEEILEESPCKRWSKRREQVKQRDVPGIDVAYLAMDNETGNEVVWNEVQFSERKNFRAQEAKINAVFDNLMNLVHTNLVKFHKYWTDATSEKPRIIFITEYMSSGSMSLFLQRTRKSGSTLSVKAWKKWTTQILSALNYLHSSNPPIIHGNLTCNTVFIQQNGLIKIGCVAPDAINHHVKTCRENLRNMHYMAPEYEYSTEVTPAMDMYAFGWCALEIATCGSITATGTESSNNATEAVEKALASLDDPLQRCVLQELISECLDPVPERRPSARQLLFHPALFEVHSLKLLAAHVIVDSKRFDDFSESIFRVSDTEKVVATCKLREMAYCQVPAFQVDLEKFLDDVRNGIYPLTAFAPLAQPPRASTHHVSTSPNIESASTDGGESSQPSVDRSPSPPQATPSEGHNAEPRSIVNMKAKLEGTALTLELRLDDEMNRQLTTSVGKEDTPLTLVHDLVHNGFICASDSERVMGALSGTMGSCLADSSCSNPSPSTPSSFSPSFPNSSGGP